MTMDRGGGDIRRPITFTLPKQLLVEGDDERRFLRPLISHLGLPNIEIQVYDGRDNLSNILNVLPSITGFASTVIAMGILRDADRSKASAFRSTISALHAAGLPEPEHPLTVTGTMPSISVFILPDCVHPGSLETLCLQAVRGDPAMVCVDQYFDCLREATVNLRSSDDKRRLHAFLASRRSFRRLIGEAADGGCWEWQHPAFEPLVRFLRQL